MTVERCLNSMVMDAKCSKNCSERPIHEFGLDCGAYCLLSSQLKLTYVQR